MTTGRWAPPVYTHAPTAPGALHEGKPWRNVVHIDTQPGKDGAESWVLTLTCGHTAFRPVPPARVDLALAGVRVKPRTAPYRVRCLHCEPGENDPPYPVDE